MTLLHAPGFPEYGRLGVFFVRSKSINHSAKMEIREGLNAINELASSLFERQHQFSLVARIAVTVALPILHPIMIGVSSELGLLFWVVELPLVAFHLLLAWAFIKTEDSEEFYFHYRTLHDNYQDLQSTLEEEQVSSKMNHYIHVAVRLSLQAVLYFAEEMSGEHEVLQREVEDIVAKVMRPLDLFRGELFLYSGEARYNFALYRYDAESKKLYPYHRVVDSRISTRGRHWQPGKGHIGLCFTKGEVLYSPDVTKSPELAQDHEKGDAENYRSFISVPVFRSVRGFENENARGSDYVEGVLVVTSSEPEQFDERAHSNLLKMISMIISLVFQLPEDKIQRDNGNRNSTEEKSG